jgi:hypothetical protein
MAAGNVSRQRLAELLEERNAIIDRKYVAGSISRDEELILTLLDWQLDRIDDAQRGHALDRLERVVQAHEALKGMLVKYMQAMGVPVSGGKSRGR